MDGFYGSMSINFGNGEKVNFEGLVQWKCLELAGGHLVKMLLP